MSSAAMQQCCHATVLPCNSAAMQQFCHATVLPCKSAAAQSWISNNCPNFVTERLRVDHVRPESKMTFDWKDPLFPIRLFRISSISGSTIPSLGLFCPKTIFHKKERKKTRKRQKYKKMFQRISVNKY